MLRYLVAVDFHRRRTHVAPYLPPLTGLHVDARQHTGFCVDDKQPTGIENVPFGIDRGAAEYRAAKPARILGVDPLHAQKVGIAHLGNLPVSAKASLSIAC
jgi:hypothetical protein